MVVMCLYGCLNDVSLASPALEQQYDDEQQQDGVENLVYPR